VGGRDFVPLEARPSRAMSQPPTTASQPPFFRGQQCFQASLEAQRTRKSPQEKVLQGLSVVY
jgi:hypothetical protein